MKIESIQPYGANTLIINFTSIQEQRKAVVLLHAFALQLKEEKEFQISEAIISHFSLNLIFEKVVLPSNNIADLKTYWSHFKKNTPDLPSKCWELPVCFDASLAPDLYTYFESDQKKVTAFIAALAQQELFVHFFGFQPGFAYLGGVPKELQLPRHKQPRLEVPKGAFAMGGSYAAVYPQRSPGGWQLIGQTPFVFFDMQRKLPLFLNPGEGIRVLPISISEFKQLQKKYEQHPFLPKLIKAI
jgi:inhibitor of KinA